MRNQDLMRGRGGILNQMLKHFCAKNDSYKRRAEQIVCYLSVSIINGSLGSKRDFCDLKENSSFNAI